MLTLLIVVAFGFRNDAAKARRTSYAVAMNEMVTSVDVEGGGNLPQKTPPPISQKPKFDLSAVSRPPKPEHPPPQVPRREEW